LQPDFRTLWNTSIFHRKAYQRSFSTAARFEGTGKSVTSFQSMRGRWYSAANRVIRLHRPFLEPLGLTYPQYLAMLALYEGVPQSVGDLGLKLGMDTGTLTPLLKRLAAAGLVTRARDPADERRVLIGLTEAGEALREAAWSIPEKIETACRLSDEDLAELRDTLDELAVAPST
jgi:DNA-binding MarR family transcriptional regulator